MHLMLFVLLKRVVVALMLVYIGPDSSACCISMVLRSISFAVAVLRTRSCPRPEILAQGMIRLLPGMQRCLRLG